MSQSDWARGAEHQPRRDRTSRPGAKRAEDGARSTGLLGLQRSAGNRAVTRYLQLLPTSSELQSRAGAPKQDKKILGAFTWRMSKGYKAVLSALDRYDQSLQLPVPIERAKAATEAKELRSQLADVGKAASSYVSGHRKSKDPEAIKRVQEISGVIAQIAPEAGKIGEVASETRYAHHMFASESWKVALARHGAGAQLSQGRMLVPQEEPWREKMDSLFARKGELPAEEFKRQRDELVRQGDERLANIEKGYLGALGELSTTPDAVSGMGIREIAEVLVETARRSDATKVDHVGGLIAPIARSPALAARVGKEAALQREKVEATVAAVEDARKGSGAAFSDAHLADLLSTEEYIGLVLSRVRSSYEDVKEPIPPWVFAGMGLAKARTEEVIRAYRRMKPNATWDDLPKSVTGAYSLLGPTNPVAEWAKPAFKERVRTPRQVEEARATGEANTALGLAYYRSKHRAEDDMAAARKRLAEELKIDPNDVDEVLRQSLLVLARAPLTINFSHGKLDRILESGGFKNYWQVNTALSKPTATSGRGSDEDLEKATKDYEYQQNRLRWEGALFGGTTDLATKFARSYEQAISTGVNIGDAPMGAAPALDYGRSVAWLKESVKARATYTPWDQEQLLTQMKKDAAVVGPKFVSTQENLAAVIRYAEPDTVRAIVDKARNPAKKVNYAPAAYVEAQVHGPITLADIDRITICIDDIEGSVQDKLIDQYGSWRNVPPGEFDKELAAVRKSLEDTLRASGIKYEFRNMPLDR